VHYSKEVKNAAYIPCLRRPLANFWANGHPTTQLLIEDRIEVNRK